MTLLVKRAKRIIVAMLIIICSLSGAYAQNEVPTVQMKHIDGQQISSEEVFGSKQPILLVFWATWCNHTSVGLSDIQDDYLYDWQDEFNLKVVAVSVDDAKPLIVQYQLQIVKVGILMSFLMKMEISEGQWE